MTTSHGKTLWQMFQEWRKPSTQPEFINPLRLRTLPAFVDIDDLDYPKDSGSKIIEVREYHRNINDADFVFTDYCIGDTRLRFNDNTCLLLSLDDEQKYSDEFLAILNDPSKLLTVHNDGGDETYQRVNDVGTAWDVNVRVLTNLHDQPETEKFRYWDYSQEKVDEANQPFLEFLFVEMDRSNGWFTFWKGKEIHPNRITII